MQPQPSSRFIKRPCLKGIIWEMIEQDHDILFFPLNRGSMHTITQMCIHHTEIHYTYKYTHHRKKLKNQVGKLCYSVVKNLAKPCILP